MIVMNERAVNASRWDLEASKIRIKIEQMMKKRNKTKTLI